MHSTDSNKISSPLTQYDITVLLVDDQKIVAAAVERMLGGEKDITFHYCQDPTKAIRVASEIFPTVILQDLVMPEIDGLTLVRFFRAHPQLKDVPLIVLSTKEEAITKADAFSLGANDYLVKLPDKVELIARIRYHSHAYINLLQRNEAYNELLKSQQALASELAIAADHVTSLLPQPITAGPILTDWYFVPSTQLGGDSFGYHWIDEDHFAMYLLDVCDHGVGSALLSVSALNVLRSQSLPDTDFKIPEKVLSGLNDAFQMDDHNNLYFTLWYGVLNTKNYELKYASGGHPPAFLFSGTDRFDELITKNFLIGGLPGSVYKGESVQIERPARLYIFSDGVYEVHRQDGTMWGLSELHNFLMNPHEETTSEIEKLYSLVHEINGNKNLDDDYSILKVSFL
ncbi:MAG: SpoIIE family protein phosphatase [Candidatus Latescibacteria bacterium]|nr:SpoIIE family protein phosphatase [Candidatus Latescibacterota bacterium]